jgi:peptidoglycan hydrolase-like protein with peptidoglycan-binding domain
LARRRLRPVGTGHAAAGAPARDFQVMKRFISCFLAVLFVATLPLHADDSIRDVQTRLKAGGFYFGEINGRYDSETAAGVTRYQIRNGLKITGKLDQATRYALGLTTTEPKIPIPRFGQDVWRYLRKSDQVAINKMIAEEAAKKQKPNPPATVSANSPTPRPSVAATSSERGRDERLHDYIAAFVLAGLDPQVGAETEFFADRVNYFGEPGVTKEKIRRDLERYNERWPERAFTLAGPLDVRPVQERLKVTFPLRYELRNGSKTAAGKVWKTLLLEKTGRDDLQIVAVDERKAE